LQAHVAGALAPFTFDLIAGGHSNLTFKVTGADGAAFVLRRPPLGHVLASAHDMGREHRIISGLQQSAVPGGTGAGLLRRPCGQRRAVLRDGLRRRVRAARSATAEAVLTVEQARRTASESLVDTMAAIHAVDLQAAGLHELGRTRATSPAS
jgi:aminoglycoside phosphotransferase (APT) family kinase protein